MKNSFKNNITARKITNFSPIRRKIKKKYSVLCEYSMYIYVNLLFNAFHGIFSLRVRITDYESSSRKSAVRPVVCGLHGSSTFTTDHSLCSYGTASKSISIHCFSILLLPFSFSSSFSGTHDK